MLNERKSYEIIRLLKDSYNKNTLVLERSRLTYYPSGTLSNKFYVKKLNQSIVLPAWFLITPHSLKDNRKSFLNRFVYRNKNSRQTWWRCVKNVGFANVFWVVFNGFRRIIARPVGTNVRQALTQIKTFLTNDHNSPWVILERIGKITT